jgi:probable F420-dependent oxidoreductase
VTSVKLGIVTPVLTRLPGAHAQWEVDATIETVSRIAVEAERLGYHHLTCSEHVAIPTWVAAIRGSTYWDPLATLGFLAARTSTIRLVPFVVVLGYHHPLALAKRYGTLDCVATGRLVLGVGVGTLREEFELLDAPFDDRGARADDAIRALRAALSQPEPEYHGEFYDFEGFVVDPCAVQAHVPIWVGGQSARSLRRAVELADGWAPFGLRRAELGEMLESVELSPGFEVVLQNEVPFDPGGDPERVRDAAGRLAEAGATTINVRLVHHSLEHYLEQLSAMRELSP